MSLLFTDYSLWPSQKLQFQTDKLLRHAPQPCELVDGVSFVLTNKAIGQQELDGEGVRLALDAVCVERERVGADPARICVGRTYGVAKLMRDDKGEELRRSGFGIDEYRLDALVLEIRAIDCAAEIYIDEMDSECCGDALRIRRAVPADEARGCFFRIQRYRLLFVEEMGNLSVS